MTWFAKPSGGYGYASDEGKSNIFEMYAYFKDNGYTDEAITGIIANASAESGLNPWRWQGDVYNQNGGYGLFQYTPASQYISDAVDVPFYSPNLSVTEVTSGATVYDGIAQMDVFHNNRLFKWSGYCWRSYWDTTEYSELYSVRNTIITKYGNGTSLSMEQFSQIDNAYYATFAFLACFEGPLVPNMSTRYEYAEDIYEIITGERPPAPRPPKNRQRKQFLNSKWAIYYAKKLRTG